MKQHKRKHQNLILSSVFCILSSFLKQAFAIAQYMENEVISLPDSAFKNNGARQSLLSHIGQLKDRLEDQRQDQALQKAEQVLNEIPAKVTDPDAQTSLIEKDQEIIELLEQIDQ